jgi:hypothetical protein
MKKTEYQSPSVEVIKLNVQKAVLITVSDGGVQTEPGTDGDIAD